MTKLVFGFDIDGVVKDTTGAFLRGLGLDPARQKSWDFEESFGTLVGKAWHDAMRDPCTWLAPPLPGAVEGFTEFRRATLNNYPVYWITATPDFAKGLAEWWLTHYFGWPHGKVVIATGRNLKAEYARAFGVTHFVEDSPSNANQMAEAGIKSYLVTHTGYWRSVPQHADVHLVHDFREAVKEILTDADLSDANL